MERTRHVYPTSEIPHLWIYQKQDSAKNSSHNLFYEGKFIYSYGLHFEIARIVKPETVLFTNDSYSNTTNKHKSMVRRAIPSNFTVFTVKSLYYLPDNIKFYVKELQSLQAKIERSISAYDDYYKSYVNLHNEFMRYLTTFKLKS